MANVLETGARWRAEGVGFGRATLVAAVGSSPFQVGNTLLASDDGRLAGSVSAGCVEGAAAQAILAARRGGYREVIHFGVSDERAAEVGLSCGGEIDVLVESEVPTELLDAVSSGRSVALVATLPSGRDVPSARRILVEATGTPAGSLGADTLDETAVGLARGALREGAARTVQIDDGFLFIEVLAPIRLVIAGAGDIAVYLVRLAHALGLHTDVIDPRAAFLTRERFPDANELIEGWPDEVADLAGIDEGANVVALAHDPKIDDPAIVTALRRGSRYIGALGSRRSHAQRVARLRDAGFGDAEIARIHAPVGLDLGGHTPADIALGILAEIVSERHRGAAPASGSQPSGPIDRPAGHLPDAPVGDPPWTPIAMKRILWATDFSPHARDAGRQVLECARGTDRSIDVLTVVTPDELPPVLLDAPDPFIGEEAIHEVERRLEARHEERVLRALATETTFLTEAGLGITLHVRVGAPADEIIRLATELDTDLIVMGSHGRGSLTELLLRSTVETVTKRAPCPVLVVR